MLYAKGATIKTNINPRMHGGIFAEELPAGINRPQIIDFSTNINLYGPHPTVLRAIREAPIGEYPDPEAREACERLAQLNRRAKTEVILGHGSADLLWAIVAAYLNPTDTAACLTPTFSEFTYAVQERGARLAVFELAAAEDFAFDEKKFAEFLAQQQPKMLYLCTPNNPTGHLLPTETLTKMAAQIPETTIILDQAFLSLSDAAENLSERFSPNVICLRSLTKDHAIPGVRVGYALTTSAQKKRLQQTRSSWATAAAAQAAAIATCENEVVRFIAESREKIVADRRGQIAALTAAGYSPLPTQVNFMLVKIGSKDGATVRRELLTHGILIRDCASFGLPDWIRLAVRPPEDVKRLLAALESERK